MDRNEFQSRAGFSDRLDLRVAELESEDNSCFNPVLGFLIASTPTERSSVDGERFNPVLGFLIASTIAAVATVALCAGVSIPCWVF